MKLKRYITPSVIYTHISEDIICASIIGNSDNFIISGQEHLGKLNFNPETETFTEASE